MRAFLRALRIISAVTLFFFCWAYMPLYAAVAYAATPQGQGVGVQGQKQQGQGSSSKGQERPEKRFEKALEEIREKVGQVEVKLEKNENNSSEIETIKKKRAEIESLDVELKKEFAATEKKLKDENLPKEILDRHYKFVKHYEDNLNELKANLDGIEKPSAKSHELRAALAKAKAHLEKVKPPRKHIPLDPNKLPSRMVKGKERAPRLKKEEFERDFPPQKKSAHSSSLIASNHELKATSQELFYSAFRTSHSESHRKPILVAANGPLSGLLSSNPEPVALPFTDNGFSSGMNPAVTFSDSQSAITHEPRAMLLAQATVTPPTSDDLAETPEVQFTPEIQALATQLNHNPVKIYEYVRNNIEFAPAYGSIQGADMCLQSKICNDFDTASLLIALFRVSGIYSHYEYSTIEITIEKAMNLVGGVTDPKMVGTILATNGIPAKVIVSGGTIKAVQLEHVYVKAWIDYIPSRGAVHKQGDTWVPLDASFKQYEYKRGMDLYAAMGISGEKYLMDYITDTSSLTIPTEFQASFPAYTISPYQFYSKRLFSYVNAVFRVRPIRMYSAPTRLKLQR